MRDTKLWRAKLQQELRRHWLPASPLSPSFCCDIELGLFALEQLLPGASPQTLWALLTGYPIHSAQQRVWTAAESSMLAILRQRLVYYRSAIPWQRALAHYAQLPIELRGYVLDGSGTTFSRRSLSIAANRWQTYAQALQTPPPHRKSMVRWATPGTYSFVVDRKRMSVSLPNDLPAPATTASHQLHSLKNRPALQVSFDDLRATAQWMDAQRALRNQPPIWVGRMAGVELHVFNPSRTQLQPSDKLLLQDMQHIVGMVSAGKSTLMDVLAVYLAHAGYHTTLVVMDVMSVLEQASLLSMLGLKAAPILGNSNRQEHLKRLHRSQSEARPQSLPPMDHAGFRWLSTACPLDGLRDTAEPLGLSQRPCLTLVPASDKQDDQKEHDQADRFACPFWHQCPYHQAQQDLATAQIWIATPESLVYTHVASQLSRDRMCFAELVVRRSDVVIVDEADRMQIRLDMLFSPAQQLVSRQSEAWLSRLAQHVADQLGRGGRGQLRDPAVAHWCQAHDTLQLAASRVYALLLQSSDLQDQIERNYFTAWMLLERLAHRLSQRRSGPDKAVHDQLMKLFDDCIDDPLGDRLDHALAELVRRSMTLAPERSSAEARAWLQQHYSGDPAAPEFEQLTKQFELALSVAVLSNRLDAVIRDWREVEEALHLEGNDSPLFQRLPDEYAPEIPAAPMGNVLAFQYLRNGEQPDGPGNLRFFRCMGVGRWLLLHFNTRFGLDGFAGPHVLLLSATSWSGSAPGFDIQVPISGVLSPAASEVAAIRATTFQYEPALDPQGKPIRISGLRGHERVRALEATLSYLARRNVITQQSRLEQRRAQLPAERQRILLVVGSYDEARQAAAFLQQLRPDWIGQIIQMVPDDDEADDGSQRRSHSLQRGMIGQFASTNAWILIAPLLAIERGHNILNTHYQAALGAVYFLLRPHPRPDDLSFAITSINRWAVTYAQRQPQRSGNPSLDPEQWAIWFRRGAYRQWRRLIHLPMQYSTLDDPEHAAVTWNQLVTIWQVIGRLVRGGVPAQVYFCDAAFAPFSLQETDVEKIRKTSLLLSMRDLLEPYFTNRKRRDECALAEALYGPLYQALINMEKS